MKIIKPSSFMAALALPMLVTAVAFDFTQAPLATKSTPVKPNIMLMIDDSGSMCQEQRALSQVFDGLSDALDGVDYRVAVTNTDLQMDDPGVFLARPAAPVASLNCRDENDEPLVPDTADCAATLAALDDPALIRPDQVTDQQMLERWMRCLVTLGTGGDGFEAEISFDRNAEQSFNAARGH